MVMTSYYICALITAISALTSLGFSIHVSLSARYNKQTSAFYASSRSIALAIACLIPFIYHSKPLLIEIAVTMIIVQLLDAAIGISIKNKMKTYGPALTALINLFAVIWILN